MVYYSLGEASGSPGLAAFVALLVALAFGAFAGGLLGVVHVKLKGPSFIASLGFMSLWQSVALLITAAPVSISKSMWGTVGWFKINVGVVGLPLILALIWIICIHLFQRQTALGRSLYAIGGNERASRIAGIHVDRTKIIVFTVNGMCAALGGYFLAAKLRSSAPTVGDPFTLLIVASVALGGTSLSGGRGSVLGTLLGVFTVSIIQNGMNFIGVDAYWQNNVNAIAKMYPDGRLERIAQSLDCDGLGGELDQPGEPIVWNGILVASCFDLVTDDTKVNTAHEMPATLSMLEI